MRGDIKYGERYFIAIDRTLTSCDDKLSESASVAIVKSQMCGHRVYLCNRRSREENLKSILFIDFDGYVDMNNIEDVDMIGDLFKKLNVDAKKQLHWWILRRIYHY